MSSRRGGQRTSPAMTGRRPKSRRLRRLAVVALVSFGIGMWAPYTGSSILRWPSLSLTSVRAWLTSWDSSVHTPAQVLGSSSGSTHQVPAAVTRALGKAAGTPRGTSPGQLGAYHAHGPSGQTGKSGPDVKVPGFNAKTSKLLPAESTATQDVYQNANGTFTRDVYAGPVNYQTSSGSWAPIDTTLASSGGRWREKGNSLGVSFAPTSGVPVLGSVDLSGGESYGFGLAGAATVTGTQTGSSVTYPGVLPETDLQETAGPEGLKESLTLYTPAAASSWVFPLTLTGLTPVVRSDGSVILVNAAGTAVAVIPAGQAWDSARRGRSGLPAAAVATSWQLVAYNGGLALQLSLPEGWLADPSRVFPVTVDPSSGASFLTGSTYVEHGTLNANHSADALMPVGTYNGGGDLAYTFLSFGNLGDVGSDAFYGDHVTAADLLIWNAYAWTCASPEPFNAYEITSSWNLTSISWPGPSTGNLMGSLDVTASSAACGNSGGNPAVGGTMDMSLSSSTGLSDINSWTTGASTNLGIALKAPDPSNSNEWKKFDGTADGHAYTPFLSLTYAPDVAPQINGVYPQDNYNATSLVPELQASGGDPDSWPDPPRYYFAIYNSAGTLIANSTMSRTAGSLPGPVPSCSASSYASWLQQPDWTPPQHELQWGQTYYWQAYDCDGLEIGSPSTASYFTTQVPQPTVGQATQNSGSQGVRPGGSDYTTSVTDANVSTVGPSLSIVRDYDSANFAVTGAFGAGWSSILDMKVVPGQKDTAGNTDTEIVTYPDGSQVGFGENYGGSFTAPEGRYATLAAISGGYTLTDKNDTVYSFTEPIQLPGSATGYGISSITDALNNQLQFIWNASGQITRMQSLASGRSLYFTWSTATPPHVTSVQTDPVTPGPALTWGYTYSGDKLATACPPISTTACTTYAYTPGTDYPGAVLATSPYSYWRLDESPGTATAASSVLVNEQTDAATYTNVTLGQPGALQGSTATAAGFNGSTSYITLKPKLVSSANYQSIGVWFKTTTAGVIFSSSQDPITSGTTTGDYVPNLYVGTDGYLYGEYWDGSPVPMKSAVQVTDGQWHFAVLTCAGSTESLYLDNHQPVTPTGNINVSNDIFGTDVGTLTNDYLGAGFIGGTWPAQPNGGGTATVQYFNGTLSDPGFWDRPLTPTEVAGLYQAGDNAATQLFRVTRPSSSIYAQVVYSTVTGAVTQVTDDNDGTWHVQPPAVQGSSQLYLSAVLGQQPAGYWRLSDPAGTTTAINQVNGATATYNNVTLGSSVTGPFADQPAASFDGADSYVALPQAFATASSASAEVWFNAGATSEGVLLGGSSAGQPGYVSGEATVPVLWVGANGLLYGNMWTSNGSHQLATTTTVNDGKWHQAVLTASLNPYTLTLYLDGSKVASASTSALAMNVAPYLWAGAGPSNTGWNELPTNGTDYYNGSISEVALFTSQLTAAQVTQAWQASQSSTGLTPVETQNVTDPGGKTISYQMDPLNGDRVIAQTDGLGNITRFGYDTGGFQDSVTDPNGNVAWTTRDVRGNVVSQTTCQNMAAQNCTTEYKTYKPDDTSATLTASPLNDLVATDAGPGSASATDPAYLTTYVYTALGEVQTETSPPVPGFPAGRTTTYTYTTTSTPAYNASGQQSGTTPAGLRLTKATPGGAVTSYEYYSDGDTYQVTNPDGMRTTYTYDGLGRKLSQTEYSTAYPAGLSTTYAYDQMGQVITETHPTVTDPGLGTPHTAQTTTGYDPDGDILSQTVADLTPAGQGGDPARTVTRTYNSHDQLATSTDGAGNKTTYTYDDYGNKASQTDPAGNITNYAYDPNGHLLTQVLSSYTGTATGACQNVSGGLVELSRAYDTAGRLAAETDANCDITAYGYTDNGLVSTITRCTAWTLSTGCQGTTYTEQASTYNAAGQLITRVTNNGQTTARYTPDAAGRTQSQTLDPAGLNRTTTYTYSPDDAVLTQKTSGSGGTPASVTSSTYDPMGNRTSTTIHDDTASLAPSGSWPLSPAGNPAGSSAQTYAPDQSGNGNTATLNSGASWASGGGVTLNGTTGTVTTTGPAVNTSGSYAMSAWVKVNSATGNQTVLSQDGVHASGFYLMYDTSLGHGWSLVVASSDSNSATFTGVWGPAGQNGTWAYLTGVYNAASHTASLYVNGTLAGSISYTGWSATGPVVAGAGLFSGSLADYLGGTIANVQAYPYALSSSQVSQLYGEGRTGAALGTAPQTTSWALDSRGLPTSMTDPRNNTTSYVYDQAGQLAETTSPVITTQVHGIGALQVAPVSYTSYNTFGEPVQTKDPDGNQVFTSYDNDGRPVTVTEPDYTPPDGTGLISGAHTTTTYTTLGQVASQTDPLGNQASYTYDQLGNVLTKTTPAGTTSFTYDGNSDQLSVTSPAGAVTDATYDFLGRQITSTQVERYPTQASYTTTTSYGASGTSPWITSVTTPDGVVTSNGHDAAGEQTSLTDGAQDTTSYAYDAAGRLTRTTSPDNTYSTTTYDEAGNPVGQADYSSTGSLLRSDSAAYDASGNQLTTTDYRGNTASFTYNAVSQVTGEVQPQTSTTSITTSFGYDAAGNPTLYTDGNGNNWWTTYNSWNLPESRIEPTTAAAPTAADSTFTTSYNADGDPAQLSEPGGITITDSYNTMQELTGQSGTGASAATASRSFGYNAAGQVTSASAPGGTDTFTYNDRGQVLSGSGPSGTSSYSYNGDGLVSSVADAAGTTGYTYDTAGRLATLADPATGTTLSYSYNPESQVNQVNYGSSGDVQLYGYNGLHQLTSDTLQTHGGATVASIGYGYDANGNLTSKNTTGFGASASNSYTYNYANELASWNNGTTTTNYSYDSAGNRTHVGTSTYTYDARDELTGNGTSTYAYTMAGNLASVTGAGGSTNFTSDSFGQTITAGSQTYAYDALGRMDTASGTSGFTFSYDGTSQTLASDGVSTYTWNPGGTSLAGIGVPGSPSSGKLTLTDAHTDVVGDFTAAGSSLTGSATYDPLGNPISSAGMTGRLGYQSAWADQATNQVHMGARWYNPATGQFTSRDTAQVSPEPHSAAANPFAYVADNPLTGTDPTGHMIASLPSGCTASTQAQCAAQAQKITAAASGAPGPGNGTFNAGICAVNINACVGYVFTGNGGNPYTGRGYTPPATNPGYCNASGCTSIVDSKTYRPPAPPGHLASVPTTTINDAGGTNNSATYDVLIGHHLFVSSNDPQLAAYQAAWAAYVRQNQGFPMPSTAGAEASAWVEICSMNSGLCSPGFVEQEVAISNFSLIEPGWKNRSTIIARINGADYIGWTSGALAAAVIPITGYSNIANKLGYSVKQIKTAMHAVKNQPGWRGFGGNRNPDVGVDPISGEVYPQLPDGNFADDSIGNIFEYLPAVGFDEK